MKVILTTTDGLKVFESVTSLTYDDGVIAVKSELDVGASCAVFRKSEILLIQITV